MTQQAASGVPKTARQEPAPGLNRGAAAGRRDQWWWTEASIWTERMVSALERRQRRQVVQSDGQGRPTGDPRGGVAESRPQTTGQPGWTARAFERFAAQADRYLSE